MEKSLFNETIRTPEIMERHIYQGRNFFIPLELPDSINPNKTNNSEINKEEKE